MSSVIVVCGPPGVGKSKVADLLTRRTGGTVLRTDEIRKDLFGPEPSYSWKESKQTYNELFDRARNLLQDDETVILDGTFSQQSGRKRANHLAQEYTDPYSFTLIRVTADDSVVRRRISNREDDISDADYSVYQSIRDRFEPVELPHVEVDNSRNFWHTMRQLRAKDLYSKASYYK